MATVDLPLFKNPRISAGIESVDASDPLADVSTGRPGAEHVKPALEQPSIPQRRRFRLQFQGRGASGGEGGAGQAQDQVSARRSPAGAGDVGEEPDPAGLRDDAGLPHHHHPRHLRRQRQRRRAAAHQGPDLLVQQHQPHLRARGVPGVGPADAAHRPQALHAVHQPALHRRLARLPLRVVAHRALPGARARRAGRRAHGGAGADVRGGDHAAAPARDAVGHVLHVRHPGRVRAVPAGQLPAVAHRGRRQRLLPGHRRHLALLRAREPLLARLEGARAGGGALAVLAARLGAAGGRRRGAAAAAGLAAGEAQAAADGRRQGGGGGGGDDDARRGLVAALHPPHLPAALPARRRLLLRRPLLRHDHAADILGEHLHDAGRAHRQVRGDAVPGAGGAGGHARVRHSGALGGQAAAHLRVHAGLWRVLHGGRHLRLHPLGRRRLGRRRRPPARLAAPHAAARVRLPVAQRHPPAALDPHRRGVPGGGARRGERGVGLHRLHLQLRRQQVVLLHAGGADAVGHVLPVRRGGGGRRRLPVLPAARDGGPHAARDPAALLARARPAQPAPRRAPPAPPPPAARPRPRPRRRARARAREVRGHQPRARARRRRVPALREK